MDTVEQSDKETHTVRSERVLDIGASVPVELGAQHWWPTKEFWFPNLEAL